VVSNTAGTATSQSATLTVTSAPPPNKAPRVSAGAKQILTFPATVTLNGVVTDDGLPDPPGAVAVAWSKVSGPGTVTFGDPTAVSTTASFSRYGSYVLKLTASDGARTSWARVTIRLLKP